MASLTRNQKTRRQLRGFVLVWTFITLMMGLATFVAIFFASRPIIGGTEVASGGSNNGGSEQVVVIASRTAQATSTTAPTNTPEPEAEPTEAEEEVVVAQAASETAEPTATPAPTDTPAPLPDEDETFRVGIQLQVPQDLNPDVMNGFLRSVSQDLGVPWIKKQVRWEDIEPEQGQYNFAELDLLMAGVRTFGIRPMFSIVTAPDWAREPGVYLERHGPPANNEDYVNFVRALYERYPGQILAVEVWNEQNIDREWTSVRGLSASNYVSLLRDVYNMTQEVSPGTIVISGALSPTGVDDGVSVINDQRYMRQMIDAGMLDVTDCVGVHHNGYNISPLVRYDEVPNDPSATYRGPFDNPHPSWSFRSTLEGYLTSIRNAGYDTKLCITEFGWAVAEDLDGVPRGFEFARDNTLEEQAEFFVQALDYMEENGNFWLAFVWNFNYGPLAGWDPSNDNVPYSLIGPGSTFRPAYDAIRAWQDEYEQQQGG
jgi:hypothetical protein